MFSFLGIQSRELRHIATYLLSLVVSTLILGIFTNLFSGPLEKIIDLNPTTIFILVFLLLVTLGLAGILQLQLIRFNKDPEHAPAPETGEYGLLYSLSFMVLIIFKGCAALESLSPWIIIGAGSVPLVIGKIMMYPYIKYVKTHTPHSPTPPTSTSANSTESEPPIIPDERNLYGINIPAALDGRLDVEKQKAIVIIVIETILSIKKFATQSEIFEACRRFKKGYLSISFMDTIQRLMLIFFHERQLQHKEVVIRANDPENYIIFEKPIAPTEKA